MRRSSPNILITGTPGVGKTSHCVSLAEKTGLRHLAINRTIKDQNCHDGWDVEHQSYIINEDKVCNICLSNTQVMSSDGPHTKVLDAITQDVVHGGVIIDWHVCDIFPTAWIDLVLVLRAETEPLYDRLKTRNYPEAKLQENIDTEIMEVILDEARQAYEPELIVELESNTVGDMDSNVERLEDWISGWKLQQRSEH